MGHQVRKNPDGTITLSHETQTWNREKGSMDIVVHGEVTMPAAEWVAAAVAVLQMSGGGQGGIVAAARVG